MKKLMLIAVIVVVGYTAFNQYLASSSPAHVGVLSQQPGNSDSEFASAYQNRASQLQIRGRGSVVKLLPDDNKGSRHQRFILRLDSGQTLLVAHNVDLAPRVAQLHEGDVVSFYGEYEWNEKGGLMHWTHHDPNGSHIAGWIEHQGHTYQ